VLTLVLTVHIPVLVVLVIVLMSCFGTYCIKIRKLNKNSSHDLSHKSYRHTLVPSVKNSRAKFPTKFPISKKYDIFSLIGSYRKPQRTVPVYTWDYLP
jgi:hypothetical protein